MSYTYSSDDTCNTCIYLKLFVVFDLQPGILGIFQKLLASKVNDHHGFSLVNCLLMHAPRYMASCFHLLYL